MTRYRLASTAIVRVAATFVTGRSGSMPLEFPLAYEYYVSNYPEYSQYSNQYDGHARPCPVLDRTDHVHGVTI